jgi:hypothetical protein
LEKAKYNFVGNPTTCSRWVVEGQSYFKL